MDSSSDNVEPPVEPETSKEPEEELTAEEIEERRKRCCQLKQEGTAKFSASQFEEAIDLYTQAINVCPPGDVKEKSILHNNRAAVYLHMEESEENLTKCVDECTISIELNPSYVKPYLKRANTYRKMGKEKLDSALEDFEKVIQLDPSIKEAHQAIPELKQEIDKRNEELKNEMIDKLKGLGNLVLNKFGLSTDNFQMVQNPDTGSYSINFKS